MATFAVTSNSVVSNTPYLKRKLVCTGGATSLTYTHGERTAPNEVTYRILTETPTVTTVIATAASATTMKLDTLGDAADAIEIYLTWYNQPGSTAGLDP